MKIYRVKLTRRALAAYQALELGERQFVYDLIEDFKIGRKLEGDYAEGTHFFRPTLVKLVSNSAVTYSVDHDAEAVRIVKIDPADR